MIRVLRDIVLFVWAVCALVLALGIANEALSLGIWDSDREYPFLLPDRAVPDFPEFLFQYIVANIVLGVVGLFLAQLYAARRPPSTAD